MAKFFEDETIEVTDGDVALLIEPEYEPTEDDYIGMYEDDDLLEFGFDPYSGTYEDDVYGYFESDLWEGLDF